MVQYKNEFILFYFTCVCQSNSNLHLNFNLVGTSNTINQKGDV